MLTDQVAIVTGGATGLGLAIAKRLGELGAHIAVGSRNAANLEQGGECLRALRRVSVGVTVNVGVKVGVGV